MPEQREVRLGLVLYGGVSLAVYENGVAQEMYRAMRGDGFYGLIGQLIQSRVVIDVISGTSAGGVNGVMLAYALAQRRNFLPSADLWRDQGDILRLMGERADGTEDAVLDSQYYWQKLRDCFATGLPKDSLAPEIDELDLFVTSTDANGALSTVYDEMGHAIDVKNHRALFKLSYRGPRPKGKDARKNDFAKSVNELATLCRMTSCFPVAFHPVSVPAWATSLMTWGKLRDPAVFLDGGLLNNKPFSSTIDAIATRTARGEVERFLIYVEPSPEQFCKASAPPSPSMARAAFDSLVSIPSYQSIAADLAAVEAHNQRVAAINDVLDVFGKAPDAAADCMDLAQVILPKDDGCPSVGYYKARSIQLRDAVVKALLDDANGRGYFPVPESVTPLQNRPAALRASAERDDRRSGRLLVQSFDAWRGDPLDPLDPLLLDRLLRYDVFFRLRRVRYLSARLMRAVKQKETVAEAAWNVANHFFELYEIAQWAMVRWLTNARDIRWEDLSGRYLQFDTQPFLERQRILKEIADEFWQHTARKLNELVYSAIEVPVQPSADARAAFYQACSAQPTAPSPTNLLDAIDSGLKAAITTLTLSPDADVAASGSMLRNEFCRFLDVDRQVFPLQFGSDFESTDTIRVVRFSPLDAQRGLSVGLPEDKVRGIALADFGAFFKKSWRANDILVGRLDAACLLTECLLTKERLAALGPQGPVSATVMAQTFPHLDPQTAANLLSTLNAYLAAPNAVAPEAWSNLIDLLVAAEHHEIHLAEYPNVVAGAIQQEHDWGRYTQVPMIGPQANPIDAEKPAWQRFVLRPDATIVETAARAIASSPVTPFAPGSAGHRPFLEGIPQTVLQEVVSLAIMRLGRGLLASVPDESTRGKKTVGKILAVPVDVVAPVLYRLSYNQRVHPESVPLTDMAVIVACVMIGLAMLGIGIWGLSAGHLWIVGLGALALLSLWLAWLRR